MKYNNFRGFTLVELIVVITIVGILSTIGFVSYSGYLTGARDANRVSQITKISDALQVYETNKNLPLPDNYINITASGTTIGYQWYVGVDVQEALDFSNGGKDPKDDRYFTYYLSEDRSNFQLLAYMEEPDSVSSIGLSKAHAIDYTNRFMKVYGANLGLLTQSVTNLPAQEVIGVTSVDIVSESSNTYIAHISDEEKIEWMGTELRKSIPNASCKRIKQSGNAGPNGLYTINPAGIGKRSVYCNMEDAGGWWTLVGRSVAGSTGNIGWSVDYGNPGDDKTHYSLGSISANIPFSEIMAARYTKKKNIDYAVTFGVDDDDLNLSSSSTFATTGCKLVYDAGLTAAEKSWNHCHRFQYWWDGDRTDGLFFRSTNSVNTNWLENDRFNWYLYDASNGAWHDRQAMIFIK